MQVTVPTDMGVSDTGSTPGAAPRPSPADGRVWPGRKALLSITLLAVMLWWLPATTVLANPCNTIDTCIPQLRYGETRSLREVAAQMLGERGNPKAVPALAAALSDDLGEFVRVKAAEALGRIGTPATVKPLITALTKDPREFVREAAARALGILEKKDGRFELVGALTRDASWRVRVASAWALSQGSPTDVIIQAIALRLLQDPRQEVRLAAAPALARMKSPLSAAVLIETLAKDPLPVVRVAVARALTGIDSKGVDQALIRALAAEPERVVRRQVAITLGLRKKEVAVGPLVHTLREDVAIEVRAEAATALSQIGGKEARAALEYFAKNSGFVRIRRAARDGLEDFRKPEKKPPAPKPSK